jgi:hypothetical protein
MPRIFLSYSRQSLDRAKSLVAGFEALGYRVRFDEELSVGQDWWDGILARIRESDVFMFLLDRAGLKSAACQREFEYAVALGKEVMTVLVDEHLNVSLSPPEMAQFFDYRTESRVGFALLVRALIFTHSRALPEPLPAPPETPAEVASNKVWVDPATGLMWAKRDNGSDINWPDAMKYAENLRLGGYADWRLPTIDEVETIHDASAGGHHIKGAIKLTGWWCWSSTPGSRSGSAWVFDFVGGRRGQIDTVDYGLVRALCVRRAGE